MRGHRAAVLGAPDKAGEFVLGVVRPVSTAQRDAVEALHAHPYLAPDPDRFKRVAALRKAVLADNGN